MAVNVTNNFRSKSAPVFIETLLTASDIEKEKIGFNDLPFLKHNEGKKDSDVDIFIKKPKMDTTLKITSAELTPQQVKAIESPNELNSYLITFQEELSKSLQEYETFQQSIGQEVEELSETLKIYRKEYDEESDMKIRLENSIKDIEKKKDNLTFTKSKLSNQLKQLQNSSDLHESKLETLTSKVNKLQEKRKTLELKEYEDKKGVDDRIEQIKLDIEKYKKLNDLLEHEIKVLATNKKRNDKLLSTVKPMIEMIGSESNFNRDGVLKPNSQAALAELFEYMPDWKQEILEELDKTRTNEVEWKLVFKTELRKYLSIKYNLDLIRSERDSSYQIQKMSEYQASLEFGGYANALPKPGHKSKQGNKSTYIRGGPNVNPGTPTNGGNGNGSIGQESTTPNGGWHNFYGQVYSNEPELDGGLEPLRSKSPLGFYENEFTASNMATTASTINRLGSPSPPPPQLQPDIDSVTLQESNSLQPLLLGDPYGYNYQPLQPTSSNNLWSTASPPPTNPNYVGLNSLGFGNNEQFLNNSTNGSNGSTTNAQSNVSGFGDLFQGSLNQSGSSLHVEHLLGSANPIRGNIFLQFKSLDLPQNSPPYISYTSPSPVPSGLDGFLMSPSPSTSGLVPNELVNGVNQGGIVGAQLPNISQHELIPAADSLSMSLSTEQYPQSISPQVSHLPLNHHNLWNAPYGHSRNILNHSQSQIWRNDASADASFGTTLSDYNSLVRRTERLQTQEREKNVSPYFEETYS